MEVLFISDLHLDQAHPKTCTRLIEFLKARASNARALYILGDLFEIWLGDDDDPGFMQPVFDALNDFAQRGELYFMHGNRDFLVGEDLARKLNFRLLPDPFTLTLGNQFVALMHGDLLCTDDVDYQKFRELVRSEDWQKEFLSQPLAERRKIAAGLRQQSADAMHQKKTEIMDVNPKTVDDFFDQLGVALLIHGHTHRPAKHQLDQQRQRIVLGDWQPGPSYLSWRDGEFSLVDSRVSG